jgi:hypothetical protein
LALRSVKGCAADPVRRPNARSACAYATIALPLPEARDQDELVSGVADHVGGAAQVRSCSRWRRFRRWSTPSRSQRT